MKLKDALRISTQYLVRYSKFPLGHSVVNFVTPEYIIYDIFIREFKLILYVSSLFLQGLSKMDLTINVTNESLGKYCEFCKKKEWQFKRHLYFVHDGLKK